MEVESSNAQSEAPQDTFEILYKNGERRFIRALSYLYQPAPSEIIKFFDSETEENRKAFLRAHEVASVIALSCMAEPPQMVELQSQVKHLTNRMDNLENNLGDLIARAVSSNLNQIVISAVNAAFAQRGL